MSDHDLKVTITWRPIQDEKDWDERRCVYAYADLDELAELSSVAYIGKADPQSVRECWDGHQADGRIDQLDIDALVLVGTVKVADGSPLTEKLLGEIEGLLIHYTDPFGNRKRPTILRAGLVITNEGLWYGEDVMATDDLDEADFQDESLDDEDDEDD